MSKSSDGPKKKMYFPMKKALQRQDEEAFKTMLAENPDERHPEKSGFESWIHTAARSGLPDTIRYLLSQGMDVNVVGGVFKTNALHSAAMGGHCEVISLLLDEGCAFDVSESHKNPLLMALHEGHPEAARLLIERGIDTTVAYGDRNFTALQGARDKGYTAIVELLGGDPAAKPAPIVRCDLPDWTGKRLGEEQLVAVEEALGLTIPMRLRTYLLQEFPEQMFFEQAPDSDEWKWLGPDSGLFHTARSFLAYNCKDPGAEKKTPAFPDFFLFGTNGGGDYWCIRLDESNESVHIYLHEADEFEDQEQTVAEFVQDLIDNGYGRED